MMLKTSKQATETQKFTILYAQFHTKTAINLKIVIWSDQKNRVSDISVSFMAVLKQPSSKPRGYRTLTFLWAL